MQYFAVQIAMLIYLRNLLVVVLTLFFSFAASAQERPNILFVLTEDQGPHSGAYGTPGVQTPNMDSLAKRGTLFEKAFVNYPVCSASKAAFFTGLYCTTNGIRANTYNYFKPASQVTEEEKNRPLSKRLHIIDAAPTLIEKLRDGGYYTGITHKLHVLPNEKFPFDQWLKDPNGASTKLFLEKAKEAGKPWFFLYNIPNTHRPYRDSDKVKISTDPNNVKVPKMLPDTPIVRQDWAEYLDAIQVADGLIGQALDEVRKAGQTENTIVIFLGDHGPGFQRGKMAPYDLGLHIPLIISGPDIQKNVRSKAIVGEIDLMPTILDFADIQSPKLQHGQSLKSLLIGKTQTAHPWMVGEVHHGAQQGLPNGMQERTIYDGRFRLIYRQNPNGPRDFNADLIDAKPWGNRTYAETVLHKDEFPLQYEFLRQLHPQKLGGKPSVFELYDDNSDPDEIKNLANDVAYRADLEHLRGLLIDWAKSVDDKYLKLPILKAAQP